MCVSAAGLVALRPRLTRAARAQVGAQMVAIALSARPSTIGVLHDGYGKKRREPCGVAGFRCGGHGSSGCPGTCYLSDDGA